MLMTRTECLKRYGSNYYVQKEIDAGRLYRIEKGIYSNTPHVPELAVITLKYPKAIVTMQSAFYHYGLTDVIPDVYDLATDRDAAKISDSRVRQFFIPKNSFLDGVTTKEEQGYTFRIYNRERMLIELLRYKNILPFDLYKEILQNYRRIIQQLRIQEIQDYALAAPKSNMIMDALQMEVL